MMTSQQIARAAAYYARATVIRTVYDVLPEPDPEADALFWKEIMPSLQAKILKIVEAIFAAANQKHPLGLVHPGLPVDLSDGSEIPISVADTKASIIAAMKRGCVRLRPDINHCRDCERAYEMGQPAPLNHPVVIEIDRRTYT